MRSLPVGVLALGLLAILTPAVLAYGGDKEPAAPTLAPAAAPTEAAQSKLTVIPTRLSPFVIGVMESVTGPGETHALCAIGHRLVESGRSVIFAPAYRLVQDLLAAKRDLALPRQLRKLDTFDFLLLDDLGYLPQGAEESEVLFTLIAERYERRSLGITSNLVFSEWERIFANPMATAAAIDRVVHHSVILEFDVPSYRTGVAQQRSQQEELNRQNYSLQYERRHRLPVVPRL